MITSSLSLLLVGTLAQAPAETDPTPASPEPTRIVRAATILSNDDVLFEKLDVLTPREPVTFAEWTAGIAKDRVTWYAWGQNGVIGIDRRLPQIQRLEDEARILTAFEGFTRQGMTGAIGSFDPATRSAFERVMRGSFPGTPLLSSPDVQDARIGFHAMTMVTIQGADRSITLPVVQTMDDDKGEGNVIDSEKLNSFHKGLVDHPLRPVALTAEELEALATGAEAGWRSAFELKFTFLGTAAASQLDGTRRATDLFARGLQLASEQNANRTRDLYEAAGFRLKGHTPADSFGTLSGEDQDRLSERVVMAYAALGFQSAEEAAAFLRSSSSLSYETIVSVAWCTAPPTPPSKGAKFSSISVGRIKLGGSRGP